MTATEADLALRVRAMVLEADGVLSLSLDDPTGADLPRWEPGAHVDVELAPGLVRQYSLCGDLRDSSRYRIAVLREVASRGGSAHVHELTRPGDIVRVGHPRNNFPLLDATRYILIAGGIGITPLLSMAHALEAAGAAWRLYYGGRRRESMPFLDDPAVKNAASSVLTGDEGGRLDLEAIGSEVDGDVGVYCCGPARLIEAVEARARSWPQGVLHVERFHSRDEPSVGLPGDGFTVECRRSDRTVWVAPGQSILAALRAAGLDPTSSCEEGVCGTCETKVLEGQVDHRDSVLTDAERESSNSMMTCCSRAISERLVLDL